MRGGGGGAGSWIFGKPFLTTHYQYLDLPLVGKVPASTAMLFDVGVFSLVVGAIVLMLIAIAHQSLRVAPRPKPAEEPRAEDGPAARDGARQTAPAAQENR